jgi:hypothetical protein
VEVGLAYFGTGCLRKAHMEADRPRLLQIRTNHNNQDKIVSGENLREVEWYYFVMDFTISQIPCDWTRGVSRLTEGVLSATVLPCRR